MGYILRHLLCSVGNKNELNMEVVADTNVSAVVSCS